MNESSKDWQDKLFDRLMANFMLSMATDHSARGKAKNWQLALISEDQMNHDRAQAIAVARSGIRLVAVDGVRV